MFSGKDNNTEIKYEKISTQKLSDDELKECADLFSNNYGNYSESSDIRPGEKVKMSVAYYKKNYCLPDFSVALARHDGKIVGQAFYIRKQYDTSKIMTWVVQLVIDKNYRQRGIASTLLRSIWGFSDDYAWGLATANPCTVKTLESATFRKCNTKIIHNHIDDIGKITRDIGFAKEGNLEVSDKSSQINSHFSVDNSGYASLDEYEKKLGKLKNGREWLAFTFQDQDIDIEQYKKNFGDLISFSEMQLKDAYSRMETEKHSWAKGTSNEVEFILNAVGRDDIDNIIDLGCGIGRHAIEIAQRGYNVTGIDFSESNIDKAKQTAKERNVHTCSFECGDIRNLNKEESFDLAICLYDVIGSFPSQDDNEVIIKNAYRCLRKGGFFIASVMNMELTEYLVPEGQKGIVSDNPELLLKLKPGNIMQKSGDVFDPNYLAIDIKEGLVYRKEQFDEDDKLPAEYVIRDKRYRMNEIVEMLEKNGFSVDKKFYVRAGHFDEPLDATDTHAKEMLVIAKKCS